MSWCTLWAAILCILVLFCYKFCAGIYFKSSNEAVRADRPAMVWIIRHINITKPVKFFQINGYFLHLGLLFF